ncbi:MAG: hypothetical protein O9330_16435 [Beijerinckiaceae bacterium]|jgi:hypothetical protein|nr:hypothetical protein [Beijerinckiaceae bacterium]
MALRAVIAQTALVLLLSIHPVMRLFGFRPRLALVGTNAVLRARGSHPMGGTRGARSL